MVVVLLMFVGKIDFELWWVLCMKCIVDCFYFDLFEKVDGVFMYCGN